MMANEEVINARLINTQEEANVLAAANSPSSAVVPNLASNTCDRRVYIEIDIPDIANGSPAYSMYII